jgi:PAS domain-containing protein
MEGDAFIREAAPRYHDGGSAHRRDGTEVSLGLHPGAIVTANGRHYAFVRDISERKRVERERDEALGWMRVVLEQSPVGLILSHDPRATT